MEDLQPKNRTRKIRALLIINLILLVLAAVVFVYTLVLPTGDFSVADEYIAPTDGRCVVGWVNANRRVSTASLGFTPYVDVTQIIPFGYQLKVFDIDQGDRLTMAALSDVDVLIFTDESDLSDRNNNVQLDISSLQALKTTYELGLGVIVNSGNGGRTSSGDFAANLALDVVNYLQSSIVYQDTNLQAAQIAGTTSGPFVFLNGWAFDTRGLKYSYTGNVSLNSPAICAASVEYGTSRTCLLSYLPPAGGKGFMLVDANKGFIFNQIQAGYRVNPRSLIDFPFPKCDPNASSPSTPSSTQPSSTTPSSTPTSSVSTSTTTSRGIEDYSIGLGLAAEVIAQNAAEATIDYRAIVKNNDTVLTAENVLLQVTFPSFVVGADVTNLSSYPAGELTQSKVTWQLGDLLPGGEVQVQYRLRVTNVNFGQIPNLAAAFVDLNTNQLPETGEKLVEDDVVNPLTPPIETTPSSQPSSQPSSEPSSTPSSSAPQSSEPPVSSSSATSSSSSSSQPVQSSSAIASSSSSLAADLPDTAVEELNLLAWLVGVGLLVLGFKVYMSNSDWVKKFDSRLFESVHSWVAETWGDPEEKSFRRRRRSSPR